ncbi:MAG: sigma-E processing peptidase SpoIIGA [Clostridia bacterium]|nr:sigma-E processing peptidase SpoIIGA [Clostridia bacterium]
MTIYLDIVFLENILLNYIIILSTAIISKEKINFIRIVASSILGGVFSIVSYITDISIFSSITIKIIISIIMIRIAFSKNKIKKVIKILVFFYLVSFTFGGIAFMLLFLLKPQNIVIQENRFVGIYPLKVTVLAGGVGFLIISVVAQIIKNKIIKNNMICELEIFYKGKNKKIKTMLDTGNLLKEPISNADVVIVEKESLKEVISNDILENINTIVKGKWLEAENIHSYKLKIIPFSSLGNDNGLLIGFKPDYIKIYSEDEIVRNDVIIGIYNGKLSRNNMYTSLIGLDILNIKT